MLGNDPLIYSCIIATKKLKVNLKIIKKIHKYPVFFRHNNVIHKERVINLSKKNKDEKKPSKKAVNKLSELGTEMAEIWNGYNDTTNSDVLGSYTGNPADSDKRPEQDSDDL